MEVAVMCGVATQDYGHWVNRSTGKVGDWTDELHIIWSWEGEGGAKNVVAIVPDMDKWKLDYLTRLLTQREEAYYRADEKEVNRFAD